MALTQIGFVDKETLNDQPSIAAKNKVTAGDMNEIKSVVNGACTQVDTNTNEITILSGKVINSSGSDANGNYVKFEDGTMICYIEKNVSNFTFTQDSIYYFYNVPDILFPQTFYSKPIINVSLENTSEFRRLNVGGTYNISTTGIGSITIWNYWASTGDAVKLHIIAIGRWKA